MFRLTKQADYGIVLLTHMAPEPTRRFSATELSAAAQISLPMVSKTLKVLVKGGLLTSHRGTKGGYTLSLSPKDISVTAMITALDGPIAFTECIDGAPGECSQEAFCRLRSNWQQINLAVRSALESISLAELTYPLQPLLVQLRADGSTGDSEPIGAA